MCCRYAGQVPPSLILPFLQCLPPRKVFLVFCGSGMGLAAIIFAAVFWVSSNPDSLIFGSSLLSQLLSNNILVVLILVLFLGSFQFGFAPMRYTLLSELFIPREQVLLSGRQPLYSHPGNCGKPGPQHVLVLWFCHDKDVPPALHQLWARLHLCRNHLRVRLQHPLHPSCYSRDKREKQGEETS